MTKVTICMEGGGNNQVTKAVLRLGMDEFLRDIKRMALEKGWKWRLIPCGGRQQAYDTFRNRRDRAGEGEIVILLVDAEAPVTAPASVEHLRARRGDGWDLNGVDEDHVHLMAQAMETWIIVDPDILSPITVRAFAPTLSPGAKTSKRRTKRPSPTLWGPGDRADAKGTLPQDPPCRGPSRKHRPEEGAGALPPLQKAVRRPRRDYRGGVKR